MRLRRKKQMLSVDDVGQFLELVAWIVLALAEADR